MNQERIDVYSWCFVHGRMKGDCGCKGSGASNDKTKRYVAYGRGFSGDFDTREEAQSVVDQNGSGSVYVRLKREESVKTLGQIAYEAYFNTSGGKSLISGAPLPTWDDQKHEIQSAWEAAASAVKAAHEPGEDSSTFA